MTASGLLLLIFCYIVLTVINVSIADNKNRNGAIILLSSLLFTPFLVWFWLIAVPALPPTDRDV